MMKKKTSKGIFHKLSKMMRSTSARENAEATDFIRESLGGGEDARTCVSDGEEDPEQPRASLGLESHEVVADYVSSPDKSMRSEAESDDDNDEDDDDDAENFDGRRGRDFRHSVDLSSAAAFFSASSSSLPQLDVDDIDQMIESEMASQANISRVETLRFDDTSSENEDEDDNQEKKSAGKQGIQSKDAECPAASAAAAAAAAAQENAPKSIDRPSQQTDAEPTTIALSSSDVASNDVLLVIPLPLPPPQTTSNGDDVANQNNISRFSTLRFDDDDGGEKPNQEAAPELLPPPLPVRQSVRRDSMKIAAKGLVKAARSVRAERAITSAATSRAGKEKKHGSSKDASDSRGSDGAGAEEGKGNVEDDEDNEIENANDEESAKGGATMLQSFANLLLSLKDSGYLRAFVEERGGVETLATMSEYIVADAARRQERKARQQRRAQQQQQQQHDTPEDLVLVPPPLTPTEVALQHCVLKAVLTVLESGPGLAWALSKGNEDGLASLFVSIQRSGQRQHMGRMYSIITGLCSPRRLAGMAGEWISSRGARYSCTA